MITREEIEAAKTPNGGWTRDQLRKWGVPWPPPKGWRKRLQYPEPNRREYDNVPCWNYTISSAERDRLEMKKLYQEKSGDYSY